MVVLNLTEKRRNSPISNKVRTKRQKVIRLISYGTLAVVALIFILIAKAYFDGEFHSVESFQRYIDGFGSLGPICLTGIQALQVVIPVLPGFLGCAVGAVMFGPLVGFLCNYIGISLGSIIAFQLAKRFGMPLLQDLFPKGKYKKWSHWASGSRSYTAFLFLAMLLPLFPDDYLCYLTGVSRMTSRKFSWIVLLGKPWCILAYSLGFGLIR